MEKSIVKKVKITPLKTSVSERISGTPETRDSTLTKTAAENRFRPEMKSYRKFHTGKSKQRKYSDLCDLDGSDSSDGRGNKRTWKKIEVTAANQRTGDKYPDGIKISNWMISPVTSLASHY